MSFASTTVTEEPSEQTLAEQAAGRRRLRHLLLRSRAEEGAKALRARFPTADVLHAEDFIDEADSYRICVRVKCADGKFMNFDEMVDVFPSDMMITQIALVAR